MKGPFQVRIYLPPREHAPAHVHVVKGDAEVVIAIDPNDLTLSIREVHGMADKDVIRAFRIVEAEAETLLTHWRRYHG